MSDCCYNKCSFYTLTLQQSLVLPTYKYLRHCCYQQQLVTIAIGGVWDTHSVCCCFFKNVSAKKKGELMKVVKRRMMPRMGKKRKTKKTKSKSKGKRKRTY